MMRDGAYCLVRTEPWSSAPPAVLPDDLFEGLAALHADIKAAAKDVRERYPGEVACGPGCSECCRSYFRVGLLEGLFLARAFGLDGPPPDLRCRAREALAAFDRSEERDDLYSRPAELYVKDLSREQVRAAHGVACPLLTPSGACSVYAWRPVACRYYGFPRPHVAGGLDYCYKNFEGLRADGAEPDPSVGFDVAGWRARLDVLEGQAAGAVFGTPALRYAASVAEYVLGAARPLDDWDAFLSAFARPELVAVRRFFERFAHPDEVRADLASPHAAAHSHAWAQGALGDPDIARDLDRVVDACLSAAGGDRVEVPPLRDIMARRGRSFRRHAMLIALQVLQEP